jgi:hypothetical protein
MSESTESTDFPASWRWESDGDIERGRFVRFTSGPTKLYGRKPIAVLEVDGEERSIWITTHLLFQAFKEELERRENNTLEPGEEITIRWSGKKDPEGGGPSYHVHRITFHSSPGDSPESTFGLGTPTLNLGESDTGEPVSAPNMGGPATDEDDGIPFG